MKAPQTKPTLVSPFPLPTKLSFFSFFIFLFFFYLSHRRSVSHNKQPNPTTPTLFIPKHILILPKTECTPRFHRHRLSPDAHSYVTVRPLMSRSSPLVSLTLIFVLPIPFWPSSPVLSAVDDASFLFSRDYSPPAPPPPPPHPPPSSCADQFSGVGSFDTLCDISSNVTLSSDYTYVTGRGNVFINSDVHILCESPGCILAFNISGNFTLSPRAKILTGAFELTARSAVVAEGAAVNVTGRGGEVPEGTSGRPEGTAGGGGGHGGRGAGCYTEEEKAKGRSPADVWGGDSYAWQTLAVPASFGSKGGSTSKESDYGGGGGGRVLIVVKETAQVNGSIVADGGEGGELGGGGAGGSIYIKAQKM